MTIAEEITVTAWTNSPRPTRSEQPSHRRYCSPGIIGLAGTMLLHTLVLQTALTGGLRHKMDPPEVQTSAFSLSKSETNRADRLVFINLSKIAKTDAQIDDAASFTPSPITMTQIKMITPERPPLLDFETLALEEEKDPPASVDSGDGAERAHLLGIYTGQIQARVERIWQRPRSPVNDQTALTNSVHTDESFQCQVQIVQDVKGYVQEVLLPHCNGSSAWQRSLALAIQQASPLPAPPSQNVFSHSIALYFVGLPYAAGAPEVDYETLPVKFVQTLPTLPTSRPTQIIRDSSSATLNSRAPATDSNPDQTTN